MLLPIPTDAFALWSRSLAPVLGRFAVVVVAEGGDEIAGFVAGRTRLIPPYFGGGQAGFISDVFVSPEHRGGGLARRMLDAAARWFRSQGVVRLELQVIPGNRGARDAYLKLGWKEELTQMALSLDSK